MIVKTYLVDRIENSSNAFYFLIDCDMSIKNAKITSVIEVISNVAFHVFFFFLEKYYF